MIAVIEPATRADLDAIDEIERHSFPQPWPRETFEAELTRELARLDVARLDVARTDVPTTGQLIGFCNYWLVPDPEARPGDPRGEVHILVIATHPDHRRGGVGAALLHHALDHARARLISLATLEVRRGNTPAIAMYERAGFRTVHTRRGYYQDNGEDALVMTAKL